MPPLSQVRGIGLEPNAIPSAGKGSMLLETSF